MEKTLLFFFLFHVESQFYQSTLLMNHDFKDTLYTSLFIQPVSQFRTC